MKGLKKDDWFEYLGYEITRQLQISPGSLLRNQLDFKSFLLDHIGLAQHDNPMHLALFFDEIEGLASYHFSDEFLMVLRVLYNQRHSYPGHLLVTFAGAIDHGSLVKDQVISPFNVAEEIILADLDLEQSWQLTRHLKDLAVPITEDVHSYIYSWTSGHPHLTQRICEVLESLVQSDYISSITPTEVDQAIMERLLSPQRRDSNLKHVLEEIAHLPETARSLWQHLMSGQPVSAHKPGFYALFLTGAVTEASNGNIMLRNRIYATAVQLMLTNDQVDASSVFKTSERQPAQLRIAKQVADLGETKVTANFDRHVHVKPMARIFLCHANEDTSQVQEVYNRLKREGFEPWLDEEGILPGQLRDQERRKALKNSDFILIFFSQISVTQRGDLQREMKLALEAWAKMPDGQIHTIPVRLDDCTIPERFQKFQWVDLFDEHGLERMILAIQTGLTQRQPPISLL